MPVGELPKAEFSTPTRDADASLSVQPRSSYRLAQTLRTNADTLTVNKSLATIVEKIDFLKNLPIVCIHDISFRLWLPDEASLTVGRCMSTSSVDELSILAYPGSVHFQSNGNTLGKEEKIVLKPSDGQALQVKPPSSTACASSLFLHLDNPKQGRCTIIVLIEFTYSGPVIIKTDQIL
jgi:hypothetical protein